MLCKEHGLVMAHVYRVKVKRRWWGKRKQCMECNRLNGLTWRSVHRDYEKQRARKYYQENREKCLQYWREHRHLAREMAVVNRLKAVPEVRDEWHAAGLGGWQ
jgi:hypothetical protein